MTNATITFEGADDSGIELTDRGRPGAPFHPEDVMNDEHWKELKWVPDTGYKQTKGEPRAPLVPDWRDEQGVRSHGSDTRVYAGWKAIGRRSLAWYVEVPQEIGHWWHGPRRIRAVDL